MNTSKIAALLVAPALLLSVSACDLASSDAAGSGAHHHHKKGGTAPSGKDSKSGKPAPHYTVSQTQGQGQLRAWLRSSTTTASMPMVRCAGMPQPLNSA